MLLFFFVFLTEAPASSKDSQTIPITPRFHSIRHLALALSEMYFPFFLDSLQNDLG